MTPKIIYSFVPLKASNVHALKVLMSYLESKKIIVNWTSRKSGLRKTLMRMALPLALMVSLDLTQLPAPLSIVSVMKFKRINLSHSITPMLILHTTSRDNCMVL